jgi:organic hydroperoxide reductase OsmC/OhrA
MDQWEIRYGRECDLQDQGDGHWRRDGAARSEDGSVDVKLVVPKEMGGPGGDGANPEKLFAAGYSACFLGAMKAVSARKA